MFKKHMKQGFAKDQSPPVLIWLHFYIYVYEKHGFIIGLYLNDAVLNGIEDLL